MQAVRLDSIREPRLPERGEFATGEVHSVSARYEGHLVRGFEDKRSVLYSGMSVAGPFQIQRSVADLPIMAQGICVDCSGVERSLTEHEALRLAASAERVLATSIEPYHNYRKVLRSLVPHPNRTDWGEAVHTLHEFIRTSGGADPRLLHDILLPMVAHHPVNWIRREASHGVAAFRLFTPAMEQAIRSGLGLEDNRSLFSNNTEAERSFLHDIVAPSRERFRKAVMPGRQQRGTMPPWAEQFVRVLEVTLGEIAWVRQGESLRGALCGIEFQLTRRGNGFLIGIGGVVPPVMNESLGYPAEFSIPPSVGRVLFETGDTVAQARRAQHAAVVQSIEADPDQFISSASIVVPEGRFTVTPLFMKRWWSPQPAVAARGGYCVKIPVQGARRLELQAPCAVYRDGHCIGALSPRCSGAIARSVVQKDRGE